MKEWYIIYRGEFKVEAKDLADAENKFNAMDKTKVMELTLKEDVEVTDIQLIE